MEAALMREILALEWSMFSTVHNRGGKADCQTDRETFRVMRAAVIRDWPGPLLASYRGDLAVAAREGRNLMTEKYARMLPTVDAAMLAKVEEIVAVNVAWKEDVSRAYPRLALKGRPVRSGGDCSGATSFETYLRAELLTCSPGTIALLHAFTMEQKNQGINGVEKNLLSQARACGFATLKQAEEHQ